MGNQHRSPQRNEEKARNAEKAENEAQQEKLLEKLPDKISPGEERGERLTTGKTIARGGHPQKEDNP